VSGGPSVGQTGQADQARSLLSKGKTVEAIKEYDEVLRTDPVARGPGVSGMAAAPGRRGASAPKLVDRGQQSVGAAIASDPSYADAHFFRGVIFWRTATSPRRP